MRFEQKNSRFATNTAKGHEHFPDNPRGSVFPGPVLGRAGEYTLWLEYVTDKHGAGGWATEPLWLMWYDEDGKPTISVSATFDHSTLANIGKQLLDAASL